MKLFKEVLSLPQFKNYEAGIVVQAYLPDAWGFQTELLETLDMPPVSDYDDITLKENEHIRMIGVIVRLYEGWDE